MNRDELAKKMLDAFYAAGIAAASTFPYNEEQKFSMQAALRVCVEEVLGEPTKDEWQPAAEAESAKPNYAITMTHSVANRLIAARRSRYLKPKGDPAEQTAVDAVLKAMGFVVVPAAPFASKPSKEYVTLAEKIVAAVRKADKGA